MLRIHSTHRLYPRLQGYLSVKAGPDTDLREEQIDMSHERNCIFGFWAETNTSNRAPAPQIEIEMEGASMTPRWLSFLDTTCSASV